MCLSFEKLLVLTFSITIIILFYFWPHHTAFRILVPWPGIELQPQAVEVCSPNHETAREFWNIIFNAIFLSFLTSKNEKLYQF